MTDINREKYYDPERPSDQRRKNGRRCFEVRDMSDLHHEITRRLLCGQKSKEIAEQLGCHSQTVSNVKNSRVVQDKMEIMRGARDANSVDLAQQIQEIAPKALENLQRIIEDESEEIPLYMKAKESNNLLDRAGYGAKQRSDHRHLHAHISSEHLDEIKERAKACGILTDNNDE